MSSTKILNTALKNIEKIKPKNRYLEWAIIILLIIFCMFFNIYAIFIIIIGWLIFEKCYFNSSDFNIIKDSLSKNTKDCNELNEHIEDLKKAFSDSKKIDYGFGEGDLENTSRYNFKKPALRDVFASNYIYDCSLTVIRNAQNQPFKYVCKYFNLKQDEKTLQQFENILNSFAAAEQGKELLEKEREEIMRKISPRIPLLFVKMRKKKMEEKIGFKPIDFSDLYFPKYGFRYVSAGGNKRETFTITMNIQTLDRFIAYLSELVKFRKSAAGQRALMTTTLREKIKARDGYACRHCKISIKDEPNLLLEIDHIIPISKGGMTNEDNLQTLCWRCNRKKGVKTSV